LYTKCSPPDKYVLLISGHAPTFTLNDMGTQISGLPKFPTEVFELYNFHFHFGHNQHDGSEHSVDGRKYAGEVV